MDYVQLVVIISFLLNLSWFPITKKQGKAERSLKYNKKNLR